MHNRGPTKPAYQLTSNQMEGKSKARQEGSRRNRNSKVNISDVDRERESRGSVCAAAI